MTQTRKKLRFEELTANAEDVTVESVLVRETANGRQFEIRTRPAPPPQDDLDDLWNNVPV